jgi:hypothetical protein
MDFSWDGIGDWLGNAFSNPEFDLALGGSILGGIGQFSNMQQSNQQQKTAQQAAQVANQPIDPYQFYTPMSEAYKQQLLQTLKADLVKRGVPLDSSYASGYLAEKMAAMDNQLREQAIQNSMGQRQLQQSGLQGAGSLQQGMQKSSSDPLTPLLSYFTAQRKQNQINPTENPGLKAQPGGYAPETTNAMSELQSFYPQTGYGGASSGGYDYNPENSFIGSETAGFSGTVDY